MMIAGILLLLLPYTVTRRNHSFSPSFNRTVVVILTLTLILFFGLRPVILDTDTYRYLLYYDETKQWLAIGWNPEEAGDIGYNLLMWLSAHVLSDTGFLILCDSLLVVPIVIAWKRLFGQDMLLPLVLMMCCFFFLSFGMSMVRGGISYAFFLLALSRHKIGWKIFWIVIATSFHLSILLPAALYLIFSLVRIKARFSLIFWLFALLLATFSFKAFPVILEQLDISNVSDRAGVYIEYGDSIEYNVGFRTDFVLFSAFFIAVGLYLRKRVYNDRFFSMLLNIYIVANAFFLLTMEYPYSDRYAVLSWALIPIMICYPLLKSGRRNASTIIYCACIGLLIISMYIDLLRDFR